MTKEQRKTEESANYYNLTEAVASAYIKAADESLEGWEACLDWILEQQKKA